MTCLFCNIIEKKQKSYIIAENESNLAILDAFPASKGHVLIITRKHYNNISEVDPESWSKVLPLLKKIISKLKEAFSPAGFSIISNMGEVAFQSVFHLHIHVIPKYKKEEGFVWTVQNDKQSFDLEEIAAILKM